ncbi:acetyltransferase, putative [Trypanosoma brucei gambiense DAL972]|uniref:Acetyltransferase, putative n=1 Tax=Trypanosoma brucei gambiense (strain MHOM/CI/86/DAL972) TaxID=679716 RepID=C9ZP55_TRYB9|nr:acetyltransferase, putative [Trypanosoma brucei gambiense DAL972]CBH11183.1 acetyltransferase, putative [Trypanosoma brucei gambiense DAL972]|eukprot:XP_011773470.1 acetyltransferase, putative [Trypanosoma brucei gambiense DAL972]
MALTARGLFFVCALVTTSSTSFFLFACWPVLIVAALRLCTGSAPKRVISLANTYYDFVQQLWIYMMVLLLEGVLRVRIAYHLVSKGEMGREQKLADFFARPPPGRVKLIILNHRCHLDWLVMFPFLARAGIAKSLRIVLKVGLSRVPIFGWSMQLFRYLFLTRKWASDRSHVVRMMDYYKNSDGTVVFLFPEGTDLTESSVKKSNAYALRNNLPQFYQVLNPRSTGMIEMKNMIGAENIDEIVDVTMGYTDFVRGERPNEASLLNGRTPSKIHIVCTRHCFSNDQQDGWEVGDRVKGLRGKGLFSVPADDEALKNWLTDRFAKKELLLSRFYTRNPVGFDEEHIRSVFGQDCDIVSYDEDEEAARYPEITKFSRIARDLGMWYGVVFVILYWTVPVVLVLLFAGYWVLFWFVLCSILCVSAVRKVGNLSYYLIP